MKGGSGRRDFIGTSAETGLAGPVGMAHSGTEGAVLIHCLVIRSEERVEFLCHTIPFLFGQSGSYSNVRRTASTDEVWWDA